MERLLAILVDRLIQAYSDALVSIILYGSAAGRDYDGQFSDLNVFCVLSRLTPEELAKSEPIFAWWRASGNPSPLLMTEQETRDSTDCFPMEFSDMKDRRKVLHGRDVVADLAVDPRNYRAQLEHDLRSKLLRLRQRAAGVLSDRDALLRLCLDSVSTFCVLGRHALRIAGAPAAIEKRAVVRNLEGALGRDLAPFNELLDIRERKRAPQEADPATLFARYLGSIEQLIGFVDRL